MHVANDVMTTGNTLLKASHLKKIVLLRINRRFLEYMREHRKDVVMLVAKKKMLCAENLAGIRVQREERRKAVAAAKKQKA